MKIAIGKQGCTQKGYNLEIKADLRRLSFDEIVAQRTSGGSF
jgi:hypothetical protein